MYVGPKESLTFLNHTLIFDSAMIRWRSKNKHHTYTSWCLKKNGLHLQVLLTTPYFIITRHNWEDLCNVVNESTNNHALPITITSYWSRDLIHLVFNLVICSRFIIDNLLIMQYKFEDVKLINRIIMESKKRSCACAQESSPSLLSWPVACWQTNFGNFGNRVQRRRKFVWQWTGRTDRQLQMNQLSLRNNRLKFKTSGYLFISLEELREYTSHYWRKTEERCQHVTSWPWKH